MGVKHHPHERLLCESVIRKTEVQFGQPEQLALRKPSSGSDSMTSFALSTHPSCHNRGAKARLWISCHVSCLSTHRRTIPLSACEDCMPLKPRRETPIERIYREVTGNKIPRRSETRTSP